MTTPIHDSLTSHGRVIPAPSAGSHVDEFQRALDSASEMVRRGEDRATMQHHARQAVEKLVSSALVMPVLKSLRESSMSAGPFAPGAAERRFGPLLDQHVADSVVQGANFPVVDAIVDRYLRTDAASGGHREVTA